MERTTLRGPDGTAYIKSSVTRREAAHRLAAYEDTGLEPEEVKQIKKAAAHMMFEDVAHFVRYALSNFDELQKHKELGDYNRLRELAQADREERCVVLPVKLHDKRYYVDKEQVRETEVESIHNWTSGRWKLSTHTDRYFIHWIGYEVDFDGIGKTVFLTREEAEVALEGMKNG